MSDECDKDSGYEPDQVHFWPRANGSAAKRANFKTRKQRSLDVHDVRKGLHYQSSISDIKQGPTFVPIIDTFSLQCKLMCNPLR